MPSSLFHSEIWSCLRLHGASVCRQSLRVHVLSGPGVSEGHNFPAIIHHLWLLKYFCPSSVMIPEPWSRECDTAVPLRIHHSVSPSLHFGQFVSLPVNPHLLQGHSYWWGFRDTLVCGCNEKTLRNQWNTMSNSNGLPRASVLCRHRLLASTDTRVGFILRTGLKLKQKGVAYDCDPHCTVAQRHFLFKC